MKSARLHPLQLIKLVDQGVYRTVGGLPRSRHVRTGLLVGCAGHQELLVKGEYLFHQEIHAVVPGHIRRSESPTDLMGFIRCLTKKLAEKTEP